MSSFTFKQFSVSQKDTAMKVSTDACIFGVWVGKKWKNENGKVLDIGTGTGLLSLILTQENPRFNITALEPELGAATEAKNNFNASLWAERLHVLQMTIQKYTERYKGNKYDFIISNPPFFQDHLLGQKAERNRARHNTLPMDILASCSKKLSSKHGKLAVLYPANQWSRWIQVAVENNWHVESELYIQSTVNKPAHRICGIFTLDETAEVKKEKLIVQDEEYTDRLKELMQDYYLFL